MKIILVASVAVLYVFSSPAFAAPVFLAPCEGQTLTEENKLVICELIKSELQRGGHEILAARPSEGEVITATGVKLGAAFVVTLSKLRGEKVLFSSKLKASSMEEMDEIIPRLVRSVTNEVELAADTKVGEVSVSEESQGRRHREARKQMVFAAGAAKSSGLGDSGFMYDVSFGYAIDWTAFRLKLDWDTASSTHLFRSFFTSAGVGGRYFLSDREWSPYVGLRAGIGVAKTVSGSWLDTLKSTFSGPVLGASAGLEAYRNHDASVDVQFKVDKLYYSKDVSTPEREGILLYALQVGVHY